MRSGGWRTFLDAAGVAAGSGPLVWRRCCCPASSCAQLRPGGAAGGIQLPRTTDQPLRVSGEQPGFVRPTERSQNFACICSVCPLCSGALCR